MSARPPSKPWPMRWIVLVIVVVLIPYTWITLHYRKAGKPFEPYSDLKRQANVKSLLSAGFRRITLVAERPADASRGSLADAPMATTSAIAGGIPSRLNESLIEIPTLPEAITGVRAPNVTSSLLPYTVEFSCTFPDQKQSLANAYLYWKEDELILVTDCEKLEGGLVTRTNQSAVRLTAPGGSILPGTYKVTAVGSRESQQWSLSVK